LPPAGRRQPNGRRGRAASEAASPDGFGPALQALPRLDVKATCRRAQPLSSGMRSAYQSCLDDEVGAQKELSHKWFSFKAAARTTCTQETQIGGAPSFVELVTCLELDQQAAQARVENSKPLDLPGAPTAKASQHPPSSRHAHAWRARSRKHSGKKG